MITTPAAAVSAVRTTISSSAVFECAAGVAHPAEAIAKDLKARAASALASEAAVPIDDSASLTVVNPKQAPPFANPLLVDDGVRR